MPLNVRVNVPRVNIPRLNMNYSLAQQLMGPQHARTIVHNRRPPKPPVTPEPVPDNPNPMTGQEAWGQYAVGLDPKQFGIEKGLQPGKAFKGLRAGGGMGGGMNFGGLQGLQGLFGGGGLFDGIIGQLLAGSGGRGGPRVGGIE